MPRLTNEQIELARHVNLYQFLLDNYEEDFSMRGRELRMADNEYISIPEDSGLFTDWSDGSHDNGITFLMRFYGYSMPDAVTALLDGYAPEKYEKISCDQISHGERRYKGAIEIPQKYEGKQRNLYAYLMKTRAIPEDIINTLLDKGLLYQDVNNNLVFLNYHKNCCEIRGTNTFSEPFKQTRITQPDKFWYFMPCENPEKIYITEAAIDAISLYELLNREPAIYASMHGVMNQKVINRIKDDGRFHAILAVDNDLMGNVCRGTNEDLECIIPKHKDWNQDLQLRVHGRISV